MTGEELNTKLCSLVAAEIEAYASERVRAALEEVTKEWMFRCQQEEDAAKQRAYADAARTMAEGARMYPNNKFIVHLFESLESRFRARAAEVGEVIQYCETCYTRKLFCRECKTPHCQCSWKKCKRKAKS